MRLVEPDVLPVGWVMLPIDRVARCSSGNSTLIKGRQFSEYAEGLYPGFSASGQDVWLRHYEEEGPAIILSAIGARCGKCFLTNGKWSAVANTQIIRFQKDVVDQKFLWYMINDEDFWVKSGSGQPFVKARLSLERRFALPPIMEQRRIVAKIEELFSELDAAAESLTHARAQLMTYRQALLKAAFEGKLTADWRAANPDKLDSPEIVLARVRGQRKQPRRGKGQGGSGIDLVTLPTSRRDAVLEQGSSFDKSSLPPLGWAFARLGEVLRIVSGGTPKGVEDATGSAFPFYKVADMNSAIDERWMASSRISVSEQEREALGLTAYPAGTVIFPKRGGAILTNKKRQLRREACFDLNTMGVISDCYEISSDYIWYWFQGCDLSKIYDGSNVPQINNKNVEPLPFPICSRDEQDQVTTVLSLGLSQVDAMKIEINNGLQRIHALRQAILKRAFSGQLVPQDPSDEPADALLARLRAEADGEPTGRKARRKQHA